MKNKAFTLLEVLLSFTLLVVLSSVLFSFFHTGIKAYKLLSEEDSSSVNDQDALFILRKDLSKITAFHNLYLVLNAERLYFFTGEEKGMGKIERVDYQIKHAYEDGNEVFSLTRISRLFPFSDEMPPDTGIPLIHSCKKLSLAAVACIQTEEKNKDPLSTLTESTNEKSPQKIISLHDFSQWNRSQFPLALKINITDQKESSRQFLCLLPPHSYSLSPYPPLTLTESEEEEESDE